MCALQTSPVFTCARVRLVLCGYTQMSVSSSSVDRELLSHHGHRPRAAPAVPSHPRRLSVSTACGFGVLPEESVVFILGVDNGPEQPQILGITQSFSPSHCLVLAVCLAVRPLRAVWADAQLRGYA